MQKHSNLKEVKGSKDHFTVKIITKMILQDLRLTGSVELTINLFLPLLTKMAISFCFSMSKVISMLLSLENYIHILI